MIRRSTADLLFVRKRVENALLSRSASSVREHTPPGASFVRPFAALAHNAHRGRTGVLTHATEPLWESFYVRSLVHRRTNRQILFTSYIAPTWKPRFPTRRRCVGRFALYESFAFVYRSESPRTTFFMRRPASSRRFVGKKDWIEIQFVSCRSSTMCACCSATTVC